MLKYEKDAGKIEKLINEYFKETDLKYLKCKTGIRYEHPLRGDRGEYWIYELFLQHPKLQIGSVFYWPSDKKIEVNGEVLCEPHPLVLRKYYMEKIEKDLQALVNIPETLFLKQYKKRKIW